MRLMSILLWSYLCESITRLFSVFSQFVEYIETKMCDFCRLDGFNRGHFYIFFTFTKFKKLVCPRNAVLVQDMAM